MKKLLIIGGGMSGFCAAIRAAQLACDRQIALKIQLVDLNQQSLRKVKAAGNGRCNLSNNSIDIAHYVSAAGKVNQRLFHTVCNSFAKRREEFLRDLELPLFYDTAGRAYPLSEQGAVVVEKLRNFAASLGVEICTATKVEKISSNGDKFRIDFSQIETDKSNSVATKNIESSDVYDFVILACGTPAAPQLGSSSSIVDFAEQLGFSIQSFTPCLVPLCAEWPSPKMEKSDKFIKVKTPRNRSERLRYQLDGTRFKGEATLYLQRDHIEQISVSSGEFQITDYGLSGIAAMDLSCALVPYLEGQQLTAELFLSINFVPSLSTTYLREWLRRSFAGLYEDKFDCDSRTTAQSEIEKRRRCAAIFSSFTKASIAEYLAARVDFRDPIASAEQLLHNFHLPLQGVLDFSRAQVCAGGIKSNLLQTNLSFKQYPNLFACGEVIDIVGHTGGYNLHWAMASGYFVGESLIDSVEA